MPQVTRAQFMAEMNRRLRAHEDFKEGMEFVPFPEGSDLRSATGYAWTPEGAIHPMQQIAARAIQEFSVID